jgi:hypothetical protein
MCKIPIIMDLIAGVLLAYDLFPKSGPLLRFHNWIRDNLKETDTRNLTNKRTVIFNTIISFSIFLIILAWAWYRSCGQEASNIGLEIALFAAGAVAAWLIITPIAMLFNKIGQEGLTFPIGIAFSLAALICIPLVSPPTEIVISLVAFIYMCVLHPLAMLIAGSVRKILLPPEVKKGEKQNGEKKPFYTFAIMGLALFIVTKLIEIAA